ncbi:(Fe-S)-binding protein [Paenibacillus roseipurpureus]|uniref:(Fe-S)-binding protein n=1 Tax=Paenibacillus roseopurpureus TaxID=2918901 RepID=A0AA96RGI3_9BACL|nr:(Fe-S)-binding protein [Paenibacillus sp. MBLB1832]WNR42213.1 (Fe-S)-binding protein [Paenibacillus sp. MBLB1832]
MISTLIQFLLFLTVTGLALYAFGRVVYHRYLYIRLGKSVNLKKEAKQRLQVFMVQVFGQTKLLKDKKSGIMHIVIFYGFIILQLGALDLILKGLIDHGLPIPGYQYFTLMQEVTVGLIVLAMGYATYRRYVEKLKRLKRGWKPSIVVFFIVFLMLSVVISGGFERVREGLPASGFAPLTSAWAALFEGMSHSAATVGFYAGWWMHLLILLSFLIYVPQSKHFHIITAPINILLRRTEPTGKLASLNLEDEDAESFGVGKIEEFTQKQMLDFYSCVECGRCTSVCPANTTGKLLSPMHLITKLRDHLTEKGAAITSKSAWVPAMVFAPAAHGNPLEAELIGDVITEEELWACTTCRNCEDQCPVANEHVDKIIDMRRHLVLTQGNMPHDGQRALQNIERQGNPWGISRNDRVKWVKEMDPNDDLQVRTVKENPTFEYLFFLGSMGAYDNRSRKITHAFVKLMREGGISFAILGNEEKNSGDTPRRLGNEFLFQQLCADNIATFQKYKVTKIVTTCPHTYHTFKNEYPEFGLEAEVFHHTELLDLWVREGRLQPQYEVKERITYHDSCYLGRYNEVYEEPRNVLRAIPGVELVEQSRSRENSMCCGAGGGMMWMEETAGTRVNVARTEQLLSVKPTVISSACPYCLTMVEDGTKLKEVEEQVKARDIAEILAQSVFGN